MKALEDSDLIEISTEHFEQDSHRIEKGGLIIDSFCIIFKMDVLLGGRWTKEG